MTTMPVHVEPGYLTQARRWYGQKEVPGVGSNPFILGLWATEKWLGNDDSKVPWCGLFMRKVMRDAGFPVPALPWAAKSWASWGVALITPVVGAVVVFKRPGGHHVGIVVGVNAKGQLMVYGGNQRDGVCISPFDREWVALRWASTLPMPTQAQLPLLNINAPVSRNEA